MWKNCELVMTAQEIENDRPKWEATRMTGIGGSDAAVVMGLSNWKTPVELWCEKTGNTVNEGKGIEAQRHERLHWGSVLEDCIAKEFAERMGLEIRKQGMVRSKDNPFMIADIDRAIVGQPWILECKNTAGWNAELYENDNIPVQYFTQVQHYLGVTGAQKCFLAVLLGGNKLIVREIERNEEDIKALIEAEKEFWEKYVVTKTPPPVDATDACSRYLNISGVGKEVKGQLEMNSVFESRVEDILALEAQVKQLNEQIELKKNELRSDLIEYTSCNGRKYRVSYKTTTINKVDPKRLREEYPEVYNAVLRTNSYRTLRITSHLSNPRKKYKD